MHSVVKKTNNAVFIFIFLLILALYSNSSAFATTAKTPLMLPHSAQAYPLGDEPLPDGPTYVVGSSPTGVGNKVVSIDPYSGKPFLKIPLLHVPVGGGINLEVTVTNYLRYHFMWAQSNYDSQYYWDQKLGYDEQIEPGVTNYYPGIVDRTAWQDVPFFIAPDGSAHVFFRQRIHQGLIIPLMAGKPC